MDFIPKVEAEGDVSLLCVRQAHLESCGAGESRPSWEASAPVQGQGEGRLSCWREGEGQRAAAGPSAGPHSTELGQTGQSVLS